MSIPAAAALSAKGRMSTRHITTHKNLLIVFFIEPTSFNPIISLKNNFVYTDKETPEIEMITGVKIIIFSFRLCLRNF